MRLEEALQGRERVEHEIEEAVLKGDVMSFTRQIQLEKAQMHFYEHRLFSDMEMDFCPWKSVGFSPNTKLNKN